MNARIIKETRSVLPVLGVTMLASVAPRLVWDWEPAGGAGLAFFTLCCLLMGAACFGNEFQWRTMPLLLAQPVPRRRIWNEKMLVLAGALALGLGFFLLCVPLEKDSYLFLVLVPFCVFCAAPYLALRLQSTFLAAVLTFGLPFGIAGSLALMWLIFVWLYPDAGQWIHHICEGAFQDLRRFSPDTARWFAAWMDEYPSYLACIPVAIYCAVCYRLGYRAFLKLEAIPMQSKEIRLPARIEVALAGQLKRLLPRYGGPWTSLLRKELQIQKAAFVLALMMCVLAPVLGLAASLDKTDLLVVMAAMPIAVLAFIIPFITPGGCISEERSWGVSGWQRALPVSSRKQWVAKMAVVVFTCALLGVVLPACFWMVDGWLFHLPDGAGTIHWDRLFGMPTLDFFLGYLLWISLGVFASSLCANSAKAVMVTLGLMAGGAGLAGGTIFWTGRTLRIGPLPEGAVYPGIVLLAIYFAGLIGLTQYLAYRNHRTGEPDTRRVWMQVATVTGAIVIGAALGFVVVAVLVGAFALLSTPLPAIR